MTPSKHFIVRSTQDQIAYAFSLDISEKRLAKGKPGKTKGSRITIVALAPRPLGKAPTEEKAGEKQEPAGGVRVAADEKSKPAANLSVAELGRSQMNAGDYNGAIHTFTKNIAENPRDRVSYRLRGNAYQNIGDKQKAIEDWTTAARLGDPIIQSYLDHMQINWKEAPKK
jgi:tetratricopeptide (TPR) repeat protein